MPEVNHDAVEPQVKILGGSGREGARTPGAGGASGQRPADPDNTTSPNDSAGPAERAGDVDRARVRIAWSIGYCRGWGEWIDADMARTIDLGPLLRKYGPDSHWIEDDLQQRRVNAK